MKKKYFEPEFELTRLSLEPMMMLSDPEDSAGNDGGDNSEVEDPVE